VDSVVYGIQISQTITKCAHGEFVICYPEHPDYCGDAAQRGYNCALDPVQLHRLDTRIRAAGPLASPSESRSRLH